MIALKYCIAISIILLFFIIYISTWNNSTYEDYLYGFWTADNDEFCETAGIESMLLFIGDADKGWWKTQRECYLIMMDDLCNQSLTLRYSRGFSGVSIDKYIINAKADFDDEQLWADDITISVDMRNGVLRVYDDDKLYAVLNKQHETSNVCRSLLDAELLDED